MGPSVYISISLFMTSISVSQEGIITKENVSKMSNKIPVKVQDFSSVSADWLYIE